MDELEKYIMDHREELDVHSPSERTWKRINSGLRRRKWLLTVVLSAAALVILVLGLPSLLKIVGPESSGTRGYEALIKNDPVIKETEFYYENLLNDLFTQAKPLLTKHPELEKELNVDLSQLDSICIDIKKDLKDNISNQEVIEALINNYRIKIRILNEMLDLLKTQEDVNSKTMKNAL